MSNCYILAALQHNSLTYGTAGEASDRKVVGLNPVLGKNKPEVADKRVSLCSDRGFALTSLCLL